MSRKVVHPSPHVELSHARVYPREPGAAFSPRRKVLSGLGVCFRVSPRYLLAAGVALHAVKVCGSETNLWG